MSEVLRTGYCPICDRQKMVYLDREWGYCPTCKHRMVWRPVEEEHPEWQLYTKMRGDVPVAYRYGPEWQATALMIDGGYKTPKEAKLAWLREWEEKHGV